MAGTGTRKVWGSMHYAAQSSPPLSLGQVAAPDARATARWVVLLAQGCRRARCAARRATRALLTGQVEPLTPALAHQLAASGRWTPKIVEHLIEHDALYARRADALLVPVSDGEFESLGLAELRASAPGGVHAW